MKSKGFNSHTKYIILKHGMREKNITQTCELFGISRTTFYSWRRAYKKYGIAGLENKEPKKPQMPNMVSKDVEQEILSYVGKYPTDGPKRIFYELIAEGIEVGESGIYNVLKRNNLSTKAQRVKYSKNKDLHIKTTSKVNKTLPVLANSEDRYPGYLVIHQIEYMGTFDGIGRIYQYSFYDTASKWGTVKIYNRKQDIDIWNFFERRLVYLLKIFNLDIVNLITKREKEFLPYFVKGSEFKEIVADFKINHKFITSDKDDVLSEILDFNEYLITEFYNKINTDKVFSSFSEVEYKLNKHVREYNFNRIISNGVNKGKTPVKVVLDFASQNNTDLDTLPLWISALINSSLSGDKDA